MSIYILFLNRERTWTPTLSSLGGRMTSFSSSGISGSSNGSYMSSQDPHHHHYSTPMRVHFTDGSIAGSSLGNTKQEMSKVTFSTG